MSIFLQEFESKILELIAEGDLNFALNLIIHLANKIAYGSVSVMTLTNIFGSVTLDRLCQYIGAQLLSTEFSILEDEFTPNPELIVYIATQLYKAGGHTAVIEDLIKARPDKQHLILITDTFDSTERSVVEDRFSPLKTQFSWAPRGNALDKLRWLQHALIVNQANQVFLFNHPQDAVAVAAVQPNLTPNLVFHHHAAHLLCLGTHLSYASHIDCDRGSFYNCRNNLGITNNIYLPLVIDNIPSRSLSSFLTKSKLITCSSGSENKFTGTPYLYSYLEEIPKILVATHGVHIHIGSLSPETLTAIQRNLSELGISSENFVHIPWVKSLGMAMHEQKVDIYLDSFPLGGGRAVVEVMASGTPIIVHNNYRSRQLCTTDITYPEAFRWQKLDELYSHLTTVNSEVLKAESVYSRRYYENYHKPEILREELTKFERGETTTLPSEIKPYHRDDLQSFLDQFFTVTNYPNALSDISSLVTPNLQNKLKNYQSKNRLESKEIVQDSVEEREGKELPLVSICIPTYNGAKFIREAIISAFSQTYSNIEILISDDGSTDKTIDIVKSLKEKSIFDFLIFEHQQYGLAHNWNFCISQAKGKYIKFLFQDDLLEPNAIEEMVTLAEQDEEIGLVFSPREIFSNTGDNIYDSNFLKHHESKDVHKAWLNLKPIQLGCELLQHTNIFDAPINKIGEPSTVLIKKEVFELLGLFNSELCQLVDLEMWLRIMSKYKVGFVDKTLSHFRIHPQQQTRRNTALKDVILLDYQKLFQLISSDTRYPQSTRLQAFYRYASLSGKDDEQRQVRKEIAEQWLSITVDKIADHYHGLLGKTYQMLLNSSLKYETLTSDEQVFVNDVVENLSRGLNQPCAVQYLLAAMLYCRADQLPLQHDLSYIPNWLINDYLKFLFSSHDSFHQLGEADNYYYYMQGWVDFIHTSILTEPNSPFWHNVATQFVNIANFIPLYFNNANLKDIYIKRGEIIEFLLHLKSYEVDYEFADRDVNRKKIRLGILAAHFLPSSETFAYLPVYEYISRDFEVILYSLNQTGHPLEQYCQSCANSFKLLPQDLSEQVNIIRADDLDILFIATNVTAVTNQICLLSIHRLARIQVTSGGSVVTTGIRQIDYYISGTLTEPSLTAQEHYREKLLKLEGTAHCFSYGAEPEKVTIEVNRESLSIAQDTVVFISSANFFKIVPELINTWVKIIAEVPNSVLVLLPYGPNWSNAYPKKAFENHLNEIFLKYEISADRLIVLDPQPTPNREDIKEYFKIADIYLDSYPFAGTTSLIEPLQVNLPVIARQGTNFRSAMGAAMLQAINVSDLVTDSEESYIELAIALANNPELRQQKRKEIQDKMQDNPSFLDSRSYSAKIESLFKDIFNNYLADTLNQNLRLREINLIIFPDWTQAEESIGLELERVIKAIATYPENQKTTLLIDTSNIAIEDAEIFLSSVAMNLLMNEDLDITEGLEISLIGKLGDREWLFLLPKLAAKIILESEDKLGWKRVPIQRLAAFNIDELINSSLEVAPV